MSSSPAVDAFLVVLRAPTSADRRALRDAIAPDVQVLGPFGGGSGAPAVDELLAHPLVSRLLGNASWSEPAPDGDLVVAIATAPPAAAVGGFRFGFHLDGDARIDRVELDLLPAAPLGPQPVLLTDAHAALLAGALENKTPVIVGYVDGDGRPHLSYRATVQVLGPDQLGMWIRDPEGGLVRALAANPNLACFYSDRGAGVTLQFAGRGRIETSETVRDAVYEASPAAERNMDWRKGGVAVVIDLDRVEGRQPTGRVLMVKAPSP